MTFTPRFFAALFAAALFAVSAMAPAAAQNAEPDAEPQVFGAWQTRMMGDVAIAQTTSETVALFFACRTESGVLSANVVTGAPVPAYGDRSGPVAAFIFGEGDSNRMSFEARSNGSSEQTNQVFSIDADPNAMADLVNRLKRGATVDVAMIGGATSDEAVFQGGGLSLRGSTNALNALVEMCS